MKNKVCPICKKEKSIEEFYQYFSKERNNIRIGNYCKPCARESSRKRVSEYYLLNKSERLAYAKDFRQNPVNKEKIRAWRQVHKIKCRKNLSDSYVKELLVQKHGFSREDLKLIPEIMNAYRTQLKIKRQLKEIKNGKKQIKRSE